MTTQGQPNYYVLGGLAIAAVAGYYIWNNYSSSKGSDSVGSDGATSGSLGGGESGSTGSKGVGDSITQINPDNTAMSELIDNQQTLIDSQSQLSRQIENVRAQALQQMPVSQIGINTSNPYIQSTNRPAVTKVQATDIKSSSSINNALEKANAIIDANNVQKAIYYSSSSSIPSKAEVKYSTEQLQQAAAAPAGTIMSFASSSSNIAKNKAVTATKVSTSSVQSLSYYKASAAATKAKLSSSKSSSKKK